MIRDGAERENIEVLAQAGAVGDGLWRHVGRGGVLDQLVDVRGRGEA